MPVTFAFYIAPGGWRDRLIRAATGYPESHVEMLVIPEIKHSNLCISASKRDGNRVRQKAIFWKPDHWSFVTVPGLHGGDCLSRAIRHLGRPYDVLGAVLSVTPLSWGRAERWFCSELMAHAVGLAHPHRYTPGSFRQALLGMGGAEYHIEEKGY
jgi:hypothetical protein